jgi:hypothetical protein
MSRSEPVTRLGRVAMALSSAGTFVLAALIPKCPLCVAAALTAWGVGASAASAVAPAVKPVAFGLMAVAAITLVVFAVRRMRSRSRAAAVVGSCCSSRGRSGPALGA